MDGFMEPDLVWEMWRDIQSGLLLSDLGTMSHLP